MHVTRKMRSHIDAKIRHAIATGPLPKIEQPSTTESRPKQDANKEDGADQSK